MTHSSRRSERNKSEIPGYSRGRLGRRLLLWFLVLSLVPLLLSNGLGYLRSERIIEGLVERYLEGIADLQALHVRDQVERHVSYLRAIVHEVPTGPSVTTDVLDTYLERVLLQARHEAFEALYVYDSSGRILASAPLAPEDLQFWLDPPLTIDTLAPVDTIRIVRDSGPARAPHLRLAVALPSPDASRFLGGTIEVVGTPAFLQLPEHTAGSIETFVVDDRGVPVFVSHPHGHVDFGLTLNSPLIFSTPGVGASYVDPAGNDVLGIMVRVPDRPWRVITEVPVSDALNELRQLRRVSVFLGVILGVLVVTLAWLVAGRIVSPVRDLVLATRRLAGGDLGTRVLIRKDDEIGELGAAFNDMASELEKTSARVAQLHRMELERAGQLATVGELASGVAHEIKNPVAGIAGGLDLVSRRTERDESLTRIVNEMRRQVTRIDLAVKHLLAFARPAPPKFTRIDVNEAVERALTLTLPSGDQAGVVISSDLGRDLPAVEADPEMIRQSIVNLVMNAIQATSPGGSVTIGTSHADRGVRIDVVDTGKGIGADELQQVFKPFFTTRHQGTGLGLPITKGMIERQAGSLSVVSEPGKGSTFTIWLPAASSENDTMPEPGDRK